MQQTPRPLKVVLVHELFPPDFAGGGEYVVLETARHLQAIGHSVTVLTTGDPSVTHYEGIRTIRLPVPRYRLNFAWRRIADLAKDADLIHAFSYHALYPSFRAGRRLGTPVVAGVLALFGDVWLEMRGPVLGRVWREVERYLLGLPFDTRLHLSHFSLALARRIGASGPRDQIIVPGIAHGQCYAHPDKGYVLFTGKLDVRKGIEVVLEAARRLPGVPFRVIGWGDNYDTFAAAAPANMQVERRSGNRADYLDALAQARILLFPTKAETFGLVLAEAMASGCAVVSTSPLPFEGVRVAHNDAMGTAEAIRALWEDSELCARLGQANRSIARQYDWNIHAESLERVYRRTLDGHLARP